MKNNMIGRMALPILVAGFFSLASCDKDDKVPQQPAGSLKLTEYKAGEEFIRFEYNQDGTVKTLNLNEEPVSGDENVSFTVKYDANKKPIELTGSNGVVIKTTYANGKLAKSEMFSGNQNVAKTDYVYEGNAIKEISGSVYFGPELIPFFKATFVTAANGNITKVNGFVFDPVDMDVKPAGYVNMEYDNKLNPLVALNDFMLIFWQVSTPNNVTKEEHFDEANKKELVVERTYNYNAQGYPITAAVKTTSIGQVPVNSTQTYTYK